MDHVTALEPHDVRHTVSINKTRNLVLELSKPLSDIFQLLQQKIMDLQKKEEESKKADLNINELKKKLYKSTVDWETIRLKHPVLVCTNSSCPKLEKVRKISVGYIFWLYLQLTHFPGRKQDKVLSSNEMSGSVLDRKN